MITDIAMYKKGSNVMLSEHFNSEEFKCKCNNCNFYLVSRLQVQRLQKLRDTIKMPIRINSAFRCCNHNFLIGGEKNSFHVYGKATDIFVAGIKLVDLRDECMKLFDGVGFYEKRNFIHCDSRGFKSYWHD